MPAYYFRLLEHAVLLDDEDGVNLPDAGAARQAAITGARCIMAEANRRSVLDLSPSIEVYDAEGRPVLTLRFSEAVVLAGLE